MLELLKRAALHEAQRALLATEGAFTYRDLLVASAQVAACLLDDAADLREQRVAFLVPSGFHYVAVQWGIWRAGGVVVPLCVTHPRAEMEYVLDDAEASVLIASSEFETIARLLANSRACRLLLTTEIFAAPDVATSAPLPEIHGARRAMILYTSGTTSKPKGVVTTHDNIAAQVTALITAWEWTSADHILHVLPLHHVHGSINVLMCALWAGATCEMLPKFEAEQVWQRFAQGGLTLFMAVPTIYVKLIAAWEAAPVALQSVWSQAAAQMRLMVSGSAALPVRVLEQWRVITGHILLERYGMTEIGMALSNPLHGERRASHVGAPLPNVEVRRVDEHGNVVCGETPGEIQVRGPNVFLEYWRKPEATAAAFRGEWFCTGDIAVVENGSYRILGRASVDIIKTGGYKVSALEMEEVLREHPSIAECAVVGVADAEWGERVCAAIVLREASELSLTDLREWGKSRLAIYKLPTRLLALAELPRNAMGKVIKPEIVELFARERSS
ncbi:MAG: acyl-CoA synthetase [candidate division KSB1 bacterium]